MGSRVIGEPMPLDYSLTHSFFDARGRAASVDPLTATMFQASDLAAQRDHAEKETMLPLLDVRADDRVLDLGCGTGRWASLIAPVVAHYLGVDFSETILDIARNSAPHADFLAMNVAVLDATKLATAQPFTLVICSGILTYINDQDAATLFHELSRLTAAQCRIYVREPMAKEQRLTLNGHWSDELRAYYSAVYRTQGDYLDLFRHLSGFRLAHEGMPFPSELQNRAETEQRFCILER